MYQIYITYIGLCTKYLSTTQLLPAVSRAVGARVFPYVDVLDVVLDERCGEGDGVDGFQGQLLHRVARTPHNPTRLTNVFERTFRCHICHSCATEYRVPSTRNSSWFCCFRAERVVIFFVFFPFFFRVHFFQGSRWRSCRGWELFAGSGVRRRLHASP